jgi:hypothetical protein
MPGRHGDRFHPVPAKPNRLGTVRSTAVVAEAAHGFGDVTIPKAPTASATTKFDTCFPDGAQARPARTA